jgi:hypothetical protein
VLREEGEAAGPAPRREPRAIRPREPLTAPFRAVG